MSITISDIAQHLGLAISTVSKALNGYSDVSKETRDRVMEAAHQLGYYPSAAARNLRTQRTKKIGLLFSFPVTAISEYVSHLITGIVATAEQAGYNLILYPVLSDQFEQLTRICRIREVDGLLLLTRSQMEKTINILAQEQLPYVIVGRRVEQPNVSFISPNDRQGAITVMQHLISLGHQRIAYTTRPELGLTSRDRLAGYQQALQMANIPYDDALVVSTNIEPQSAYQAMLNLLDLPQPPTAIFAIHDLVAKECLQAILDRGLRVPEDVAVVGFDNWSLSLTTTPPLTTIATPLIEIGQKAMSTLLEQINTPDSSPTRQLLPVDLVVRQSTLGEGITK